MKNQLSSHTIVVALQTILSSIRCLSGHSYTAHKHLSLSEGNKKVTWMEEEQPYPHHPARFDHWSQVLCREGLSGRCYWDVEWSGPETHVGLTYGRISRKGEGYDCGLRYNDKSWSLRCSDNTFVTYHNTSNTAIPAPSSGSHRVGVYLDWPAGTLSFYSVSSDTLTHIHTFQNTFTEPLFPGFRLWNHDTSVALGTSHIGCFIPEMLFNALNCYLSLNL
ncbi:stonustoxin subunit beta-like [Salvelinus fontinalis]|uniref:stonustoxin subunit beta-like n=1 Tax=Salvelinus fontinalis TaxID=8038 RepID=UPI00248630FA|nr:stonustoxin subunit beta-like [Salvelinus fontinalis]